jgi:HTH-type transcriptional regulator / antitoxin HipB
VSYVITATEQLGPTLKGLRRAARLTQAQVAQSGGLRQKTVSLLENQPHRCSVDSLVRYLVAVGMPLALGTAGPPASRRSTGKEPW